VLIAVVLLFCDYFRGVFTCFVSDGTTPRCEQATRQRKTRSFVQERRLFLQPTEPTRAIIDAYRTVNDRYHQNTGVRGAVNDAKRH
jgi:hypothetical protein